MSFAEIYDALSRDQEPQAIALYERAKAIGWRVLHRGERWFFNPDYVFPDERFLPSAPRMVQTPILAEYSGGRFLAVRARRKSSY